MSRYAALAERYWTTYLPSQTAQLDDPAAHFASLGAEVQEEVERLTSDLTPKGLEGMEKVQASRAALRQAEEIALGQLVYLTPEPGTEHLELESTGPLAGWDEPMVGEQTAPSAE